MKLSNLLLLIIFTFIVSCGNVGKILRNEKINTTDEFLVKKKDPLILPPDYDKIPTPGSLSNKDNKNEAEFKKIINKTKKKSINVKGSSTVEESILNKIPK